VPIYAFTCAGCGSFEVWRPVVQAGAPASASCPGCGCEGRRVFSPPGLALLSRPLRRTLDYEEKSAHEPDVVAGKRGRPLPHKHDPTPPWVMSH
jgi:putative FmdB family regulatory protein